MKKLVFAIVILFAASMAGAQEIVYKDGETVKGKDVTYKAQKRSTMNLLLVRNMDNPDTTLKAIPKRVQNLPTQYHDMMAQVAMIIHDVLTPEELAKLEELGEYVMLVLRVDREKHRLMQVTCFEFFPYGFMKHSDPGDCFWLGLDPDRLHAIEKAIVGKLEVPELLQETFLKDDFEVLLASEYILDFEEMKAKREKYVEEWKANPQLDMVIDRSPWRDPVAM